ncbi:MAG: cytochrome c [Bacteroidales bacterium]|nr:cytochrome c [Bacteroidales bacterium]MCB8998701.1 cytochrome c [Bacteroidales bacterium]
MKKLIYIFSFCLFSITLSSCGNGSGKNDQTRATEQENSESNEAITAAQSAENGKKVFRNYCIACHLEDGTGIEGMYPPLTGATVSGERNQLISIILKGMKGEVIINGQKYNDIMKPHDFLSDDEIADVLTYIRSSFGNQASPVTKAEVKLERKRTEK